MKAIINKMKNQISKILDTKNINPLSAAVIVAVIVAIVTLLSLMAIPICVLTVSVYFLVQKLNEKNDTIKGCDRAYEDTQNLENIKHLFADVINYVNQSNEDTNKINILLKYTLSAQSFRTEKEICMFRIEFSSDVFRDLHFGSWDNLKSELQHGLNIFSHQAMYNIPPYVDYVGIVEDTVQLYALSRTDRHVIADLFLVNNDASFQLYKSLQEKGVDIL